MKEGSVPLREVPVLLLVSARFSVNEIFSVYCFDIKDWVVIPYSLFKERKGAHFRFRFGYLMGVEENHE